LIEAGMTPRVNRAALKQHVFHCTTHVLGVYFGIFREAQRRFETGLSSPFW